MRTVDLIDLIFLVGVALLAYGFWLIYPPLAYIASWALFIALAVLKAIAGTPSPRGGPSQRPAEAPLSGDPA